MLIDQQEVLVQLVIKSDEKAINVQAKLENLLNPVGYIPGAKVKRPWMHWASQKLQCCARYREHPAIFLTFF